MDFRCARAYAAGGCSVLGIWLPNFSLWHAFQLELIGSPFAGEGTVESIEDLAVAVRICQLAPLQRPQFTRPGFFARRRIDRFLTTWRDEAQRFVDWQADHLCGPELWTPESATSLKTPWQPFVVASLCVAPGQMALQEREAWNLSPGLAAWRLAFVREATGQDPRVVTDAEREAFAAADGEVPA